MWVCQRFEVGNEFMPIVDRFARHFYYSSIGEYRICWHRIHWYVLRWRLTSPLVFFSKRKHLKKFKFQAISTFAFHIHRYLDMAVVESISIFLIPDLLPSINEVLIFSQKKQNKTKNQSISISTWKINRLKALFLCEENGLEVESLGMSYFLRSIFMTTFWNDQPCQIERYWLCISLNWSKK